MTLNRDPIEIILARIRVLEEQEFIGAADGVLSVTFANLPAVGESGRMRFVTDGRKIGEGPAAGTGVPVYDDGGASWRRFSDDTAVAI